MTDVEAKLAEIDPLLKLIVRERVGAQAWLYEDALQEARIAAWTRLDEGFSIGIAVHKAKQAVIDIVRGGRTTGSKQAGIPVTRTVSLVQPGQGGDEEYLLEPADPAAEAAYDEVVDIPLEDLLAPLNAGQRAAVLGRLEGLGVKEIARREGVSHQAIGQRLAKAGKILAL